MSATETKIAPATETPLSNSYDLSPYESYPYAATQHYTTAAVASIFGLKAPAIETARVLELGCSSGGNIINTALNFPKATFMGVDLSKVQIEDGQKQIKDLGLKNITLKTMSISDIKKDFGEFDYIICHGVLSWVPSNVREDIFRICSQNLSKNGLAFISYNTLPGWNMVNSIRDMMLYHTKDFADPARKTQEARALLAFVNDALKESKTPYASVLSAEAQMLSHLPDNYLRHDHLEEDNHQFYFHDFMDSANKYGLQYVGDSTLATMYTGNLPKHTAEKMQEITDIVRSEQYMDFIVNRRFRSTILTHKENKLVRNIDSNSLKDLYFTSKLVPKTALKDAKIDDNSHLEFVNPSNPEQKIDTNSPILKALLYVMIDNYNHGMSLDQLVAAVQKKLPAKKYTDEQVKMDISATMLKLLFAGLAQYSLSKPFFSNTVSEKPQVSDLIKWQLNAKQPWITSQAHERISLNLVDLCLLPYMDGTRTKEEIAEAALKHVDSGELVMNRDNQPITDKKDIKSVLVQYLDTALSSYAKHGLFVK